MKVLCLIGCIIILDYQLHAQSWAPLGAKWYYQESGINPNYVGFTTIESVQDTIIDMKSCRKIILEYHELTGTVKDSTWLYADSGKMYFFSEDVMGFRQLYDFNKQAGDSFLVGGDLYGSYDLMVYVDSTGIIDVNGNNLRTMFTHAENIAIDFFGMSIEGIGNLNWIFPTLENQTTGPLRCYNDSIVGFYSTGIESLCDTVYFLSSEELPCQKNVVIAFPNPVNDCLNVCIDPTYYSANSLLQIFDLDGRLVKEQQLFGNKTHQDVGMISPGFYTLKITSREFIMLTNFIKE